MDTLWYMAVDLSRSMGIHPFGVLALAGIVVLFTLRFVTRSIFAFTFRVERSDASKDPIRSVLAFALLLALMYGAWLYASQYVCPRSWAR